MRRPAIRRVPGGDAGTPHTHPGEEFAYILEGSVYLGEEGKGETRYVAFRVHIIGQPERTLVDVDH